MALKPAIRWLKRRFAPRQPVSAAFKNALQAIGPGSVAVDCGANVGVYTLMLARTGATVHAFEPHPHAFAELKQRVKGLPNVVLYPSAVSTSDGETDLFLHERSSEDVVHFSQSSSLEAGKTNIDSNASVKVPIVDFAGFIADLPGVDLLKMDIEGHEIAVLNALLDRELMGTVRRAFIELHDRKNPELREPTAALRGRMAPHMDRVDLDWH